MKELTPEQIQENWYQLRNLITNTFEGDRLEKLNKMYDHFEDRMCMAPASGKEQYHYAHVGGYVEHVLHVVDCALKITNLWAAEGATINFTTEEVIFAAMHHDLGKVGDMDKDYYVPQESEWHRKNQGKMYKINPNNDFTLVNDLSIWLLQHYGISITWNEMLGIKLTDGLYDESNKPYYISRTADSKLKTNLGYVMHQADSMAARIEYERWNNNKPITTTVKRKTKTITNSQTKVNATKLFDDLFGDNK